MYSLDDWEFCRHFNCVGIRQIAGLRDPFASRQWLQRFSGDPASMATLRTLLRQGERATSVHRMSDQEVIGQVCDWLACGRLHVHSKSEFASASRGGAAAADEAGKPQPETAVPFPLSDRRAPAKGDTGRSKPATEPATFSDAMDGHAQAAALLSAAGQGVPFCPE